MKAELLAPAGSFEGLRASIAAGADAVYIGGKMFGARAYAKNPGVDELLEAIDFTHLHGKKIYLTVNTLLKNRELKEQLYDFLAPYYEQGIDGVILQDFGVVNFIKKEFPGLPIHASTQMAVTGADGAQFLAEAGVSRIVTARELSLSEIKNIRDKTGMEIESFIHGALCYCYPGMCLFSSMLGGRSGNRGRCAQPCRLPYEVYAEGKKLNGKNENYPLSLKDMCTIEMIPKLLEAGVYSLKIEGRMKKPEYAAGVTRIYRKYLDLYEKDPENYHVSFEDKKELLHLYQRDGFNQGYYETHNGRDMVALNNIKEQETKQAGIRRRDEELFKSLKEQYVDIKIQEKIYGNLILFSGNPAILDLEYEGHHIQVTGDIVQQAKKQPLTEERVKQQMKKTGNTPFLFQHLEVLTDEQGFLPMQSLNELRRKGLEELELSILRPYRRILPEKEQEQNSRWARESKKQAEFCVSVETWEQLEAAASKEGVDGIYISAALLWGENFSERSRHTAEYLKRKKKSCYLAFPYIVRNEVLDRKEILESAFLFDGFLVRNLESFGFLKKLGLADKIICDFHMYTFNENAEYFLRNERIRRTTIPLELNAGEIKNRDNSRSEWVVYGYYPMMISAQCLKKTFYACCKQRDYVILKDRYDRQFMTKCECDFCYNIIYNCIPTGILSENSAMDQIAPGAVRMNFTFENKKETEKMLDLFLDVYKYKKKIPGNLPEFTKGHFRRGVE